MTPSAHMDETSSGATVEVYEAQSSRVRSEENLGGYKET